MSRRQPVSPFCPEGRHHDLGGRSQLLCCASRLYIPSVMVTTPMLTLALRRVLPFILVAITVLLGLLGYFELVSALLEQFGYAPP